MVSFHIILSSLKIHFGQFYYTDSGDGADK